MSVPSPPQINDLPRVDPTSIQFWWDPPLSDGGSPITGYTLTGVSPSIAPITIGPSQNTYWKRGLTTGVSYSFTLTANNTNGSSTPVAFRTVICGNFPSAPQNVSTLVNQISTGYVEVTWNAPVSNGGAALKYYAVEAHGQYPDYVSSYSYGLPASQTQIQCSNLTPNQNYDFIVNSINDPGWSLLPSTTGYLFFSPSNVSDLFLWFDTADTTSYILYAGESTVSNWNSKTSNGYFLFSQANNVAPSVSQSQFGIFPAMSYVPTSPAQVLYTGDTPSLATNGPFLTFTVLRQLDQGTPRGIWSSLLPVWPLGFTLYWNQFDQFEYWVSSTQIVISPSTILTNTIVTCAFETTEIGGLSTIGITFNGNDFITTSNYNGLPGDSGFVIGNFGLHPGGYFVIPDNGLIAEQIVVQNDPPKSTRQKIEGYLAWKYNMVSELPPTHPYYTSPPLP